MAADRQQARHQTPPQGVLSFSARMVDPDRRDVGIGMSAGIKRLAELIRDQAEGDRLVEPAGGQRPSDLRFDPLTQGGGAGQGTARFSGICS